MHSIRGVSTEMQGICKNKAGVATLLKYTEYVKIGKVCTVLKCTACVLTLLKCRAFLFKKGAGLAFLLKCTACIKQGRCGHFTEMQSICMNGAGVATVLKNIACVISLLFLAPSAAGE